jgi:hypothetical protein
MSSTATEIRGLLRDDAGPGFPREFVLARLRGRRGAGDPRVQLRPVSDEAIWNGFLDELSWLFGQMNPAMRVDAAPLFALFELKTIVLCLRNVSLERSATRELLLQRSLLSAPLRAILARPDRVGGIVAQLSQALGGLSPGFRDLDTRYFEAGLKGCEDALTRLFVEAAFAARLKPFARDFLSAFADLRNLMTLHKHLRWELNGPVALINGGTLDRALLTHIIVDADRAALDALAKSLTGKRIAADDEIVLETMLLGAFSARLLRAKRERGGDWLVPDYIWNAYVRARNLAVRHHTAGLEPSAVARELIA